MCDVCAAKSFSELLTQQGYSNRSLIYTTDPNMASYKGEEKLPVQVCRLYGCATRHTYLSLHGCFWNFIPVSS